MSHGGLPPGEQRRRQVAAGRRQAAPATEAQATAEAAKADEQFVVEYPCEKYCRVEIDTNDKHQTFNHRQMRELADREHTLRHAPPLVVQRAARGSAQAAFQPGRTTW